MLEKNENEKKLQELKRKHDFYQKLYNSIPCGMGHLSFAYNARFIDANLALVKLLGYETMEEFWSEERYYNDVVMPEYVLHLKNEVKRLEAMEEGKSIVIEYRAQDKNNRIFWMQEETQMVTGEDGEKLYQCIFTDITEEKAARKELEKQYAEELLYRELSLKNVVISYRVNLTRNRIEVSESKVDYLKSLEKYRSYIKLYKRVVSFAADSKEREKAISVLNRERLIKEFQRGNTSHTAHYQRDPGDGILRWISVTTNLIQNPETDDIMAFIYTQDIHQEKMAESLIEKVIVLDYEYLMYINVKNGEYHMFGNNKSMDMPMPLEGDYDLQYRKNLETYAEESCRKRCLKDMNLENVCRMLENSDICTVYMNMVENSGHIARKQLTYSYLDNGKNILMLTRTDITNIYQEEQRRSRELQQALKIAEQANAAKSEFLSHMSHEIRTPLNAVIGMTNIALEETGNPKETTECLTKIDASSKYLLGLINDILDMSKIENERFAFQETVFSIQKLIDGVNDIIKTQADQKQVVYECFQKNIIRNHLIGDSMRTQQVLLNLLSNAIKFTPKYGLVTLSVSQAVLQEQKVQLEFHIKDTGIGIGEEFKPRLFEPFAQENSGVNTMYSGAGLGLAICRNIVRLKGGTIDVISEKYKGTEFTVRMQFDPAPEESCHKEISEDVQVSVDPDIYHGKRVLLVEDHPLNIEVASRLLQRKGFLVEVAENGRVGVEKFRESPAGFYDVILMDIRMPVMDGLRAAAIIRKLYKTDSMTVPIIAMTANAFEEDKEQSRQAGMNAHLAKPIEPQELFQTLRECLR